MNLYPVPILHITIIDMLLNREGFLGCMMCHIHIYRMILFVGVRQRGGSMLSPTTTTIVNRVPQSNNAARNVRPAIRPQATTNPVYAQQLSSSGGASQNSQGRNLVSWVM